MKDFLYYLNDKKKNIMVIGLVFLIFALVYYAYDTRNEVFLYGLIISVVFIIIWGTYDFYIYKRELEAIARIKDQWDIELLGDSLPNDNKSRQYQKLFATMLDQLKKQASKNRNDLKSMEEFFIMWTHQVKLPISAINLYLDSSDEINKSVIKGQMKRIKQYSDMVMAFVRLESDKSDFLIEELALDVMIKNTVKEFKLDFINKGLGLDYEEVDKIIITDKKWFTFVLEQVMSNALKYTRSGQIRIFLEDNFLVIQDSGIGIKKEDIARVFDKGYTGYNGRINADASGLGLYLVKRALDRLHHNVSIESELGKGTKVRISLERYDFVAE